MEVLESRILTPGRSKCLVIIIPFTKKRKTAAMISPSSEHFRLLHDRTTCSVVFGNSKHVPQNLLQRVKNTAE